MTDWLMSTEAAGETREATQDRQLRDVADAVGMTGPFDFEATIEAVRIAADCRDAAITALGTDDAHILGEALAGHLAPWSGGPMAADEGDTVWIYATVPRAAVIGWATFWRCRPIDVDALMRDEALLEAHRVTPLDVRSYAKGMRSLWAIEWSAAGRLRPSLALPLRTLRDTYGIKPTPTWVRLRDRGPCGGRPSMRGEALIRELQGRMPRTE